MLDSRWLPALIRPLALFALLAAATAAAAWQQATPDAARSTADSPQSADVSDEFEVLARGPMHEAFAAPVIFDPAPGEVVPEAPPKPIEELAPDQKPEGTDVVWVGGYWSWDDEGKDFIWVSGIWRDVPPGQQWVPGYWRSTDGGWQWVSGYWMPVDAEEVEYLPEPPASIEAGPSSEPPTPEHSWVPGCWTWHDARYAWRPGYWIVYEPDWVWVPSQYAWTPHGCVYVAGYWDYAPVNRGVVFAPIRATSVVYTRPSFVYTPAVVIDVDLAVDHFFVRPRVRHYYFGDYYAQEYVAVGYYPGFAFHFSRYGYDPIYARTVVVHRTDPRWEVSVRADFFRRRDNVELRPARTYVSRRTVVTETTVRGSVSLARPLSEVVAKSSSGRRFKSLDSGQREQARSVSKGLQDYRARRADRERAAPPAADRTRAATKGESRARRVEMPRSPVGATARTSEASVRRPPPRPQTPAPDPKAQPRSRTSRSEPREILRQKKSSRRETP